MFYIPSDLTNYDYEYYYNNEFYIVKTNICENDVCQCFNIYQNNGYIKGENYECSILDNKYLLDNTLITNDVYYRNDMPSILTMFMIISFVGFGIPLYLLHKFLRVV